MQTFDTSHLTNAQELAALRELLDEAIQRVAPAQPVKPIILRTDIATMSCKQLRRRIIRERGPQAAAVLATKLNADLATLGKARVRLVRAGRNGNGIHADAAD
jgi:hypothetical protein